VQRARSNVYAVGRETALNNNDHESNDTKHLARIFQMRLGEGLINANRTTLSPCCSMPTILQFPKLAVSRCLQPEHRKFYPAVGSAPACTSPYSCTRAHATDSLSLRADVPTRQHSTSAPQRRAPHDCTTRRSFDAGEFMSSTWPAPCSHAGFSPCRP
jgi:hypothetical protein